jgi:hypothetical protein
MKSPRALAASLALVASAAATTSRAVEPFFAPAVSAGSLVVRLHPTEEVEPGSPRLITFGVPLPRASVTPAALANLRVLDGGVEIPAFVEALTPWRHATDPSHDGTSVRVVRIQIQRAFAVSQPAFETVTVEWGGAARTQNRAFVDPRSAWHLVTTGTFVEDDGVFEPDVYAVLPASWLTRGAITGRRLRALDPSVSEARDDPDDMDDVATWPGLSEMDHAVKNNFYSVINEDDPLVTPANQCPYKSDATGVRGEPWLYDRAATMFDLYLRGGSFKALREATRHAEYYRLKLYPPGTVPANAVGIFRLKAPNPGAITGANDAMYSYAECLADLHWLTGDDLARAAIPWVVQAQETHTEATRWDEDLDGWTERHTAFRLLANTVAYEVFGTVTYRDRMLSQSADFRWHQDGAGGQLPADRLDGALYHYGHQHGDGTDDALVASSWMSALTADAMTRAYAFTEDPATALFVRRLAVWEKEALQLSDDPLYAEDGPIWHGAYMVAIDGSPDPADGYEVAEHSLSIAATIAWGDYFARLAGAPDPELAEAVRRLYATYDLSVNYWVRPAGPGSGLPAFRVSPWRKWAWEHRTGGALSFTFGPLFADGFESGDTDAWSAVGPLG